MAYATVDEVAELLGRDLDDNETVIVQRRLDHVEDIIITRVPNIVDRISDDPKLGRLLAMVEVDAVLRLIKNPDGKSGETDGNYSYRIDSKVTSGRLTVTPDEWLLLMGSSAKVGVLSIALGRTGRQESDYDPARGLSGPNTAPFEQGVWNNDESVWV